MEKKHIESGWWYTYPSEKYESVGIIIPNIWKHKTCSKPPTSEYSGAQNIPTHSLVVPLTFCFWLVAFVVRLFPHRRDGIIQNMSCRTSLPRHEINKTNGAGQRLLFLCIWHIWPWYFTPFFTWDTSPKNIYYGYIYPLKKSETADQLPPQSLTKCHMEVLGSGFRKWSNTSWEVPELFTLSRLITPIALWFIGVIYGHKPTIYVYILVIATIIAMMVYIPMMVYNNGLNDYIVYQHQFHYDISNYLLWSIYQQYLHLLWFLLTNETTSLRGHHLVMGISGEVTGSHFQ